MPKTPVFFKCDFKKISINFKRNAELFFNRLLGVQWLVDLTLHFAVGPNNEQAIPNLLTELNIFSDPDSRSFVEQKSPQFFFQWEKWYFVPKIVLTFWEKKNVLVIEAEGQELAEFWDHWNNLPIRTVKGQNNFCNKKLF